ncbi:MAG: hypothetical protein U0X92_10765 [Anaerolineales bacterium]
MTSSSARIRLISGDVIQELGLVVIDEEQRWRHAQEHLKKLRTEVDGDSHRHADSRTLYMALTGVRDISDLSTPPEERAIVMSVVFAETCAAGDPARTRTRQANFLRA